MNEVARPGAVRMSRSTTANFTRTAAIHHPPHTQADRRPERAPTTIAATAISVHRIDSDAPKAVESTRASGSHRTSHQWWMVRASSMVATATPPAATARARTGGPSPCAGPCHPGCAAATHLYPSHASTVSSTISGLSTGTYGRGDGSPVDTTQATPTTAPASSRVGPAHANT